MINGVVEVRVCPVCGSGVRDDTDGMAARKTAGYHYLKPAADTLQLSVNELAERVHVHRCAGCGSFYCDPWLSPELASHVFCSGAPDHIAGWQNFEQWLSSRVPNVIETRNRHLYNMLTERIGHITAYAEFGCPFQGFLLPMRGAELPSPRERVRVFSRALKRQRDVRWSHVARLYHLVEGWAKKFIVGLFVLRAWKERLKPLTGPQYKITPPAQRVFLTEDTTRGWGSNCVRYGASCQYFTNSVLGADVMPLAEAIANPSFRLDLIGIFNNLDHTTSPLDVVRKCLELAPNLLVVTHRASHAGRQHLYAFGDDFATWLGQNIPGVVASDLFTAGSAEYLSSDYSYILVSKSNSQGSLQ